MSRYVTGFNVHGSNAPEDRFSVDAVCYEKTSTYTINIGSPNSCTITLFLTEDQYRDLRGKLRTLPLANELRRWRVPDVVTA
jgi:hypothetical protein